MAEELRYLECRMKESLLVPISASIIRENFAIEFSHFILDQ
jgi:hypothetical protein